jgi:hypothetical protein
MYKRSINRVTILNPVYTHTRDNRVDFFNIIYIASYYCHVSYVVFAVFLHRTWAPHKYRYTTACYFQFVKYYVYTIMHFLNFCNKHNLPMAFHYKIAVETGL